MGVREFLEQVRRQPMEVRAAERQLDQLRAEAVSLKSPQLGDKVQNNAQGGLEVIVSRLEAQQAEVQEKWNTLITMRDKAQKLIDLLPDPGQRGIMTEYYILGLTWEKVAEEMGYDERSTRRIRNLAISQLEATSKAKDVLKCPPVSML